MIVVKAGGAAGVNLMAICSDVAAFVEEGEQVILVHGGSNEADQLAERLGHKPRFLTSVTGVRSRYTDLATLDVLTMAMAGRIKPLVVTQLLRSGVKAIGLTGIDAALVQARRKTALKAVVDNRIQIIRDDLTGHITQVNTDLLEMLLSLGYVPVISPPAIDAAVGPLNVDADRMAAAIAAAMHAEDLVILSNVPGVLRDITDVTSLVERVTADHIDECLALTQGRMRLKVIAAREALAGGVRRVILADGRCPSPVRQALAEKGTVLQPAPLVKEVSV